MALAGRAAPKPVRTGPRDAELRAARVCYDHLAGTRAVAMLSALVARGVLTDGDLPGLTGAGRDWLGEVGIDVARLEQRRRPACRACLDWSERRPHVAGAVGAALCDYCFTLGWVRRIEGTRAITITPKGRRGIKQAFGLEVG